MTVDIDVFVLMLFQAICPYAQKSVTSQKIDSAMTKTNIIQVLQTHKSAFTEQYHITDIGLFGSYATDQAHADSDVDLVYELVEGKRLGIKEVYDLEVFIKDVLQIEKVDLVNRKYMNPIIESEMEKSVIYV